MFKSKIFLFIIGLGFLLSSISALIAFFYEDLRNVFFVIAVVIFVLHLMLSQLAYAFYMLKRDDYMKAMSMKRCPNCNNPVYQDDATCPYCKTALEQSQEE